MEKQHYFKRVNELTPTRFWINNVTKKEAMDAIAEGAIGCTQNPAYVWKMLNNKDSKAYVNELIASFKETFNLDEDIIKYVQRALVKDIAEIFMPLYESSNGKEGYVSIQGDPFHEDYESIIKYAKFNCEVSPNIMAKIPVTVDGLKAIRYLASKGFPINATEVMSLNQALDVCDVYTEATKNINNKAPIYFSHITGIFDEYLNGVVEKENIDIHSDVLWQAGIIAAKKTYHMCKARNPEVGFIGGGARGLHHFTEMVGSETNITINWEGTADQLLKLDPPVIERFHMKEPDYVLDELCMKLEDFRKGYFIDGLKAEDYEEFGPVVLFRNSFETAWKKALDYIKTE